MLTMVRRTRGDDIDAACGQLKGQVMDRTRRQAEFRKTLQAQGGWRCGCVTSWCCRFWLRSTAGAGCSRLTFVKQKFKNDYHRTAPEYSVRDDPEDARRIAAIDEVALAQQSIQAGRLDEAATHAERGAEGRSEVGRSVHACWE